MKCQFVVGQKVAMVKEFGDGERSRALCDGVELPRAGVVYTIRSIEPGADVWSMHLTFIRFVELHNGPHLRTGFEPNFDSRGFRPVNLRPTDISIFEAMLTPAGRIPLDA